MAQDDNKDNAEGFGSRLLSGLKDALFEEEQPARQSAGGPAADPAPASAAPVQARPLGAATAASAQPVAAAAAAPVARDSAMFTNLMGLTLARQTAYTALTEAMTPLEEIIPDEMTRYRAAFAVIKKNRTLDQILQAIDLQHMEALEQEVARFGVQAKNKEFTDVQTRMDESNQLKAKIEAANAQVQNLRRELEERVKTIEDSVQRDRKRAEELEHEVQQQRAQIDSVQRQFDSTAQAVRESLTTAKAKILRYLAQA